MVDASDRDGDGERHLPPGRLPQADGPLLLLLLLLGRGDEGGRGDELLRPHRLVLGRLGWLGLRVQLGHRLLDRVLQLRVQFMTSRRITNFPKSACSIAGLSFSPVPGSPATSL